ncbi:lysosome-associated membrane glycoprotein 1 [Chironomus tepperi]|uniref:lysosome-associated membrane glycoprotein 1 n=1 Tax=Chironomus tepperi TaxID=113505 RepID=UPI00391FC3B5
MKLIVILAIILCYGRVNADDIEWIVYKDSPCLLADMNIKANFSYNASDSSVKNILYEIPKNLTKVDSSMSYCNESESLLAVNWSNGNRFEVSFSKNNKSYELSKFHISLNASDVLKDSFDNGTIEIMYERLINDSSFDTPANFSFHCTREQILNSTKNDGFSIILSQVQFEAFRSNNKDKKFSLAKDCESNFKPDIVPIAVGLSLIALIIIVLIAYIVGRRRQQARGYLNIM